MGKKNKTKLFLKNSQLSRKNPCQNPQFSYPLWSVKLCIYTKYHIKDLEACAIMVKSSDSAECTPWNPVRQLFTVWSWWGYLGPLFPSLLICKVGMIMMIPQRVGVRSMLDYTVKHSMRVCSYCCYHLGLMELKLLLLGFHYCQEEAVPKHSSVLEALGLRAQQVKFRVWNWEWDWDLGAGIHRGLNLLGQGQKPVKRAGLSSLVTSGKRTAYW